MNGKRSLEGDWVGEDIRSIPCRYKRRVKHTEKEIAGLPNQLDLGVKISLVSMSKEMIEAPIKAISWFGEGFKADLLFYTSGGYKFKMDFTELKSKSHWG